MFPKNLKLHRITGPLPVTTEEALRTLLAGRTARACRPIEASTAGWCSPVAITHADPLHVTDRRWMLCMRREEKKIPPSAIEEAVAKEADEIERKEGRQVGRRERNSLKERTTLRMLQTAIPTITRTRAWIDSTAGLLVVDTASDKEADALITLLRDTLGALPVRPMMMQLTTTNVMSGWISQGLPEGLQVGEKAVIEDRMAEGGKVAIQGQLIAWEDEETRVHLNAGKDITQLELVWNERLGFTLCEDLTLRSVRFLDLLKEEAAEANVENEIDRFDADFAIVGREVAKLTEWLAREMGGEVVQMEMAA